MFAEPRMEEGVLRVYKSYEIKEELKRAGYKYDPYSRVWFKQLGFDVSKLSAWEKELEFLSSLGVDVSDLERVVLKLRKELERGIIQVPVPEGLSYRRFQLEFIAKASPPEVRARILADEMGLGKTVQAIGVINAVKPKKVIVFCPAFLRLNWNRELQRWLMVDLPIYVLGSGKDVDVVKENKGVFIVSYDLASKLPQEVEYDLFIADEAHYLKNPKAQRTYYTLRTKAQKYLFLTGTPILNNPTEIVPILAKIEQPWIFEYPQKEYIKHLNKYYWNFAYKYCYVEKNDWGTEVKGVKNPEALKTFLTAYMDRRTKSEVLAELPNKIRSVVLLDPKEVQEFLDKERELFLLLKRGRKNHGEEEQEEELEMEEIKGKTLEETISILENYINAKLKTKDNAGMLFLLKHLIELKKVKPSLELIKNLLEEQNRLVVFTWHKDVAGFIAEELKENAKVFLVTSDTDTKKRQAYVEEFQGEGKEKMVFISTIKAGGVGLTLTKANTVVFVGLSYVPADVLQAEDRLHRIGQKEPVNSLLVIFSGSVDEGVFNALEHKQDVINSVLEGSDNFRYNVSRLRLRGR